MILDEAIVACLSPILGEGQVYSNVSPEILEREINDNFRPFAIFRCSGGGDFHTLERFIVQEHEGEKINLQVQVEVWGSRIADVRRLAHQVRAAMIGYNGFAGVYSEGGFIDRVEFGNKLFGVFQEFDVWIYTPLF